MRGGVRPRVRRASERPRPVARRAGAGPGPEWAKGTRTVWCVVADPAEPWSTRDPRADPVGAAPSASVSSTPHGRPRARGSRRPAPPGGRGWRRTMPRRRGSGRCSAPSRRDRGRPRLRGAGARGALLRLGGQPARTVDADRTKLYLAPRRPGSVWAATNKARVERLIDARLMAPAGIAAVERAKARRLLGAHRREPGGRRARGPAGGPRRPRRCARPLGRVPARRPAGDPAVDRAGEAAGTRAEDRRDRDEGGAERAGEPVAAEGARPGLTSPGWANPGRGGAREGRRAPAQAGRRRSSRAPSPAPCGARCGGAADGGTSGPGPRRTRSSLRGGGPGQVGLQPVDAGLEGLDAPGGGERHPVRHRRRAKVRPGAR